MSPEPWPSWRRKGCGTEAACRRHRRNGETPDRACLEAEAQAHRRRAAERRELAGTGAVHYRYAPDAAVYGQPRGFPACGRPAGVTLTSDPAGVTCGQCRRSGPYRQAAGVAA